MKNYVCYHLHTENSLLDSCTNYKLYIDKAVELGQNAICFSEHGNIYHWVEKKMYANEKGLKYIHGCEVYLTEELFHYPEVPDEWYEANLGRNSEEVQKELEEFIEEGKYKIRDNYHTILIAKNYEGVKEINTLIDISTQPDHFYYKPRITFDEFFNISNNVIKISACLASPLSKYPSAEKADKEIYDKLLKSYDYYEIQPHVKSKDQFLYNKMLYEASKQYGKPLIVGTDTHNIDKYKAECRSILQKAKRIAYADEDEFDLTYKSYDELVEMFEKQGSLPMDIVLEAIENTNVMASTVEDFELDTSFKYPKLYENEETVLKKRINEMYKDKVKKKIIKPDKRYKQRVLEEMRVFKKIGMVGFMLFMSELVCWCWENGIPVGFCRGSVGGSMIAYLTDIIDVNPLEWNTVFSRFANESRKEIGDIDIDISPSQRHLVYEHIIEEYGSDKTAYVLAMGTISDKGTIDEIGRALADRWDEDRITYLQQYEILCDFIKNTELNGFTSTDFYNRLTELKTITNNPYSLDKIAQIKKEYDDFPNEVKRKYPDIFYYFDGLVNTTISQSMHPAGIIVSPVTLPDNYGTFWNDGKRILSINMEEIHEVSLVKYDILGLKNIEVIKDTCELAGIPYPKSYTINWEDKDVWNHIADSPVGIFQFESKFAYDSLKKFNCKKVNDLSLVNASIRPSGESYRDRLLAHMPNKNPSELIDELLANNHGYLVFQEDVIAFLQDICGLSGSDADNVRRAIGRKQMDRLQAALPQILEGYCNKSDKQREEAEREAKTFLQIIEDSSNYMFGYNHSTGYSMIGYVCGWLRYYYPKEFITAYLNNANNDNDITMGTKLAEQMKIKVHPIRFRHSIAKYSCDEFGIHKGIESIKFLNDKIANELYQLKDKEFNTFIDLLIDIKNTSVNSKQLDILIKLNFFAEFGDINSLLLQVSLFDKIYGKKQFKKDGLDKLSLPYNVVEKYAGKTTEKIFKDVDTIGLLNELVQTIKYQPITLQRRLRYENDCLGYVSSVYPNEPKQHYFVSKINSTKYLTTINLYELYSGKTREVKMWTSQFNKSVFEEGDILFITSVEKKNKKEPSGEIDEFTGKKIYVEVPDKFEFWLKQYYIRNE